RPLHRARSSIGSGGLDGTKAERQSNPKRRVRVRRDERQWLARVHRVLRRWQHGDLPRRSCSIIRQTTEPAGYAVPKSRIAATTSSGFSIVETCPAPAI